MSKPTAEQVRKWMQQRQVEKKPPPSMDEIRRQLGWLTTDSAKRTR